jgi:FkbH-like protein
LKVLKRRGLLLAIVSKNEAEVALQAIDRHGEMVLRRSDFVGWRINWQEKADNLIDLARELNLGLSSVVFIDDNARERDHVRQRLPEVLVPEWPGDPSLFVSAMRKIVGISPMRISDEDRRRTTMYHEERRRVSARQLASSPDDWLSGLGTRVTARGVSEDVLTRTVQLLSRSNQFNLTTRRLTEATLKRWADEPDHVAVAIDVEDKFGPSGLTGFLGVTIDRAQATATISDFVVSCRVLGRGVEETLLAIAAKVAQNSGCERLTATWLATAQNKPIHHFLMRIGASSDGVNFTFDVARCVVPGHVALEDRCGATDGKERG